jgi:hypothetical protein
MRGTLYTKRIELLFFVEVVILTFVELLLFPRSSCKMVERLSFDYFVGVRDFLGQAVTSANRMESFVLDDQDHPAYIDAVSLSCYFSR